MSTRCTVNFTRGEQVEAKIYVHSDGYPEGVHGIPARLAKFFSTVAAHCNDRRFNDPSYLASKFVVWIAGTLASRYDVHSGEYFPTHALDFIGVGVCLADPGDIQYTYMVDCNNRDSVTGYPTITVKEI